MDAYEIIEAIRSAKKKTPVKAYIKASKPLSFENCHVFTGTDMVVIGDYADIEPVIEANQDAIEDIVIENDRRNSALPLLDMKHIGARIEPGAIIRDRVEIGDGAVIMMGAIINIGAVKVNGGILTQGLVIALYNYMTQILVELVKMANLIISMTKAAACAKRIGAVLELPVDMALEPAAEAEENARSSAALKEENAMENRFMLSDTTHLLSSIIGKNTTFIFEKIGTEIDHIFIDEFQDTSRLQWECFNVLLQEVLARGNFNLIVGDVKQSIYRWRNSDWNIMNNIGSYFRKDQISPAGEDVVIGGNVYKSTNYRSDSNIVSFNNALYRSAVTTVVSNYKEKLGPQRIGELLNAYSDVEQATPPNAEPNRGYAEIRFLDKDENEKFEDCAIRELISTLHRLLEEEEIPPGKIAILLRYKNMMPAIVKAFNAEFPDIRIVSDEAYMLSSSLTLQLLVAALRYIATPDDRINIVNLARLYGKVIEKRETIIEDYVSQEKLDGLLPLEFRERLMHLKGLPVYELIEQLLGMLNVAGNESEEAFIYTFLDIATQYISTKSADLPGFIKAWDDSIYKECIPAESVNSVRMMTIHSSKGLEFHTVIMPMCNWLLTGDTRTSLWCEPTAAPYNGLSLLSVPLKKDMIDSIYNDDYHREFLYQIVDNLNIVYVGTTRAKSNLIMFSDATGGRGETVAKMLNKSVNGLNVLQGGKLENNVFTFGKIVGYEEKARKEIKDDNPFEKKPKLLRQPFVQHKK